MRETPVERWNKRLEKGGTNLPLEGSCRIRVKNLSNDFVGIVSVDRSTKSYSEESVGNSLPSTVVVRLLLIDSSVLVQSKILFQNFALIRTRFQLML